MNGTVYRQCEIRWVNLNPVRGAETKKKRPCVILQDDIVNQGSRTVIIAPILPGHKEWPFVVNLKPSRANGLDKDRHVNLKQLRVVDVSRISNKQGYMEKRYFESIKQAIEIVFGL